MEILAVSIDGRLWFATVEWVFSSPDSLPRALTENSTFSFPKIQFPSFSIQSYSIIATKRKEKEGKYTLLYDLSCHPSIIYQYSLSCETWGFIFFHDLHHEWWRQLMFGGALWFLFMNCQEDIYSSSLLCSYSLLMIVYFFN